MRSTNLFLAAASLTVVLSACSTSSSGTGAPSSGGSAARTVRITALDSLKFDPATIQVRAGQTVRFVVVNDGATKHEFIVGDEQAQLEHEEQMDMGSSMPMHGTDLSALELAPGDTKEATVTFDRPGMVLYGCHEPGHYKGGMVGTITVTGSA